MELLKNSVLTLILITCLYNVKINSSCFKYLVIYWTTSPLQLNLGVIINSSNPKMELGGTKSLSFGSYTSGGGTVILLGYLLKTLKTHIY